jgi:hypothetical protein
LIQLKLRAVTRQVQVGHLVDAYFPLVTLEHPQGKDHFCTVCADSKACSSKVVAWAARVKHRYLELIPGSWQKILFFRP